MGGEDTQGTQTNQVIDWQTAHIGVRALCAELHTVWVHLSLWTFSFGITNSRGIKYLRKFPLLLQGLKKEANYFSLWLSLLQSGILLESFTSALCEGRLCVLSALNWDGDGERTLRFQLPGVHVSHCAPSCTSRSVCSQHGYAFVCDPSIFIGWLT